MEQHAKHMLPLLQAVNALDGTLLDDYTLTKPSNWSANSTVQANYAKTFIGNFTTTWAEQYGKKRFTLFLGLDVELMACVLYCRSSL